MGGVGAVQHRGNAGQPIVQLNALREAISFDATLVDINRGPRYLQLFHFIVSATWNGMPHQLQVSLGWSGQGAHWGPLARVWNWNFDQSFYSPGASIALI